MGDKRENYRQLLRFSRSFTFCLKVAADIGSLALAWIFARWVIPDIVNWQVNVITLEEVPVIFAMSAITYYLVFKYFRLYESRRYLSGSGDPLTLLKACALAFVIVIIEMYFIKMFNVSRKFLIIFFFSSAIFIHAFRFFIRQAGNYLHLAGIANRRMIIVGDNDISRALYQRLCDSPQEGWRPVGILPVPGDESPDDGIKRYHHPDKLRTYVTQGTIDEVVICLPEGESPEIFTYFKEVAGLPVTIRVLSNNFKILWEKLPLFVEEFRGVPVIIFGGGRYSIWRRWMKRLWDIFFALCVLVIGSPLWLTIAFMIKREDRGPALFTQERVQQLGHTFKLYKFRTMVIDAEKLKKDLAAQSFVKGHMFKLKDDPRITKIGKALRKFSLDEIPQFINVLKGEMSIVGPRPPLPEEVEKYEDWHTYRIRGWVGLTGLWQICGRNRLQFEEAVLFDVFYLHNFSLSLDFQIMLLTANVVLSPKGAY